MGWDYVTREFLGYTCIQFYDNWWHKLNSSLLISSHSLCIMIQNLTSIFSFTVRKFHDFNEKILFAIKNSWLLKWESGKNQWMPLPWCDFCIASSFYCSFFLKLKKISHSFTGIYQSKYNTKCTNFFNWSHTDTLKINVF